MKRFKIRKKNTKRKKIKIIYVITFLLSLIITFFLCIFLTPKIYFSERKLVFLYGEEIKLPDYEAYLVNQDISNQVKVIENIDSSKLGSYLVEYRVDSFLFSARELVLVEIIEKEAPVIELVGGLDVRLCPNSTYKELGYKANDNYDGDVSDNVLVEMGEDEIHYRVKDSSGNEGEVVRKLYYDDVEVPILELNGNNRVVLYVGSTYKEEGYRVSDNCDTLVGDKVKVSGKVDTSRVGTYLIHYEVVDNSGNKTSKTRTVEVISRPKEVNKNEVGVIYLTFDDGPSNSITPSLLSILKEEGVVATFFVVHHGGNFKNLILREHLEGHTVALHSYTHDYKQIYSSNGAYFNDLEKIRNEIVNITGDDNKIIRFPGGSSNTVSRGYQKGIMSYLSKEVLNRGYRYFDWNVSSGDAGGVSSSREVYHNVINGLSKSKSNVVLLHDFEGNYYTLNAIRDIIRYGKENGYIFKRITRDTSMVHHKVLN